MARIHSTSIWLAYSATYLESFWKLALGRYFFPWSNEFWALPFLSLCLENLKQKFLIQNLTYDDLNVFEWHTPCITDKLVLHLDFPEFFSVIDEEMPDSSILLVLFHTKQHQHVMERVSFHSISNGMFHLIQDYLVLTVM